MKTLWKRVRVAIALTALGATVAHGALTVKKGTLVTIPSTFEVKAPPRKSGRS